MSNQKEVARSFEKRKPVPVLLLFMTIVVVLGVGTLSHLRQGNRLKTSSITELRVVTIEGSDPGRNGPAHASEWMREEQATQQDSDLVVAQRGLRARSQTERDQASNHGAG
eukprot:CAMPEP_0184539700 /NCGR_PEP_ID=MMETSP0198_2-20121128/18267_1 /TAXON_ID=1112570 /ORGANISM="Thraustochytrium sp., Strain LLF1b" /LENGTH=110 /DNA_ID=CAMNT_0026933235 /DNA_START=281 /DNA_END=613 /DNA_ORIENTATION=-